MQPERWRAGPDGPVSGARDRMEVGQCLGASF